ncbi:MAG TPA: thiamine pyrophosphate-dependent enzyme [Hyphomicrobiales bacterium]|nr:thiamine pyrophosphate-dependent enzyme [Hyphomicrobiales bacterium]
MAGSATNRAAPAPSIEEPVGGAAGNTAWGSDAIADVLRALDLDFIALNPGASYRGLHDSLVNHLGNRAPQMLLCLHEEIAVAIAHGYAKVAGKPMAVAVHSNVGLMHASMAIFNLWCDRVPALILGATGPVDAAKRRPWIDWIHTTADQAALVRHFIKWDDQPASVAAATEALLRATLIAETAPQGPVYVNLDAALQESPLDALPPPPDPSRYRPGSGALPAPADLDRAAALLKAARAPVILVGRVSRREEDWRARVALAEVLGAAVVTDLKTGATFPTAHPAHVGPAGTFPGAAALERIRAADVVVSLDWIDPAGTLKTAFGAAPPCPVIHASLDVYLHRGWGKEHQGLAPVDVPLMAEPDPVVHALLERLGPRAAVVPAAAPEPTVPAPADATGPLTVPQLAAVTGRAIGARPTCLIRAPLSWSGDLWPLAHPLDYLGGDGGGGVGSGPGMAVGAALALRGSGRLPLAILGDGDFLMSPQAIWTAVHYGIPLLVVVANNRSFFNDELHQERMARQRRRPVENKWIGQAIADPDIDLAAIARAEGASGFGPVGTAAALAPMLAEAIAVVEGGGVAVVDARVATGYAAGMEKAVVTGAAVDRG